MKSATIGLVGNPNCGKTTLFNELTGARQRVGNWAGVTVEKKSGEFTHADHHYELVDLPGTYSLHLGQGNQSLDEQIAQNYILSGHADLVINIVDASSLERNLYLTTQIMDANIPIVVALNMMDVADKKGYHIDPYALSEMLGCPVVPIIASKGEGISTLLDVIENTLAKPSCHMPTFSYPSPVNESVKKLTSLALEQTHQKLNHTLLAIALLEGTTNAIHHFPEALQAEVSDIIQETQSKIKEPLSDFIAAARYQWIHQQLKSVVTYNEVLKTTLSDYVDEIVLNKWLAFPIFLFVMYLMFMFTINIGSAFIDFFDGIAKAIFVDGFTQILQWAHSPDWLIALLANGLGGGIELVASFIPVIACLFFFLSILEDSGYMARAAFIVDRLMRRLGLPGKSFVPLIVGFGCNVPSVMATRTLENSNDRLMTTIMAPFMSCGARLTVYALFAAAFFPYNGQNIVFALYFTGIGLAILSGLIIRRFLLNTDLSPFIMELPVYHRPTLKGLLIRTWQRLKGFMFRAGKAIITVVIILNFVSSIGTDGSFGNQSSEKSALSAIGRSITPVFQPMGIKEDNWPATVGIFTGVFAKEVVVGTLDTLYSDLDKTTKVINKPEFHFWTSIKDSITTIPANLKQVLHNVTDPLGINIGNLSDAHMAAQAQGVKYATLTAMNSLFDGKIGAFAYLLFVLLYIPCVATIGVIFKEMGKFWAGFTAAWTYVTAYAVSVIFYQTATFFEHPQYSGFWILSMLLLMGSSYALLIIRGKKQTLQEGQIPLLNL
jgi:ferrous iron transport protein B